MNSMPQLANPTASPGLPALASPQMLQQRIEEKGNQPNGLPNDLLDALALQQVLENQEAAKRNMVMQQAQQTGQQAPVVEQLKQKAVANARDQVSQKVAAMQMMQARAQQAQAEPQGINMAQANLGRGYAGGGIIAFSGEEQSDVPKANDPNPYKWTPAKYIAEAGIPAAIAKYGYTAVADLAPSLGISKTELLKAAAGLAKETAAPIARAGSAALLSEAAAPVLAGGATATGIAGGIMAAQPELQDAYRGNYMVSAMDPDGGLSAEIMGVNRDRPAKQSAAPAPAPKAEYKYGDNTPQPLRDRQSQYPRSTYVAPGTADTADTTVAPEVKEAAGLRAAADKMRVAGAPSIGKVQMLEDPDSAYLMGKIKAELEKDPNTAWKEGAKRHADFVGIDALLKGQEDDIAERKKLQAGIAAKRDPLRQFLYNFSAADPRKGLGGWMGAAGEETTKTMEGWDQDDLKFNAEIMKLKADVAKAKIEGREKDAAAGEKAMEQLDAARRTAMTSGTQIVDTRERAHTSMVDAQLRAAAMAQTAQIHAQNRMDDKAARTEAKIMTDMSNAVNKAQREFQSDPSVKAAQAQLQILELQMRNHPEKITDYQQHQAIIRDRENEYLRRALAPFGKYATHLMPSATSSAATTVSPANRPPLNSDKYQK